jgi:hypothetical protein
MMKKLRIGDCGLRSRKQVAFLHSAIRNPQSPILIICSLLCASVLAAPVRAQEGGNKGGGRFDLTGRWALDKSKSDFGPFKESPVVKADVVLVVAHSGPELKISRREERDGRAQTTELAYYTDGRGELNPSTLGRVGVKSSTRWDGDKIVATSTLTRRGAGGKPTTLETTDRWQLSADGRVLTQTTSISYGGGTQTIKQVYRRVD